MAIQNKRQNERVALMHPKQELINVLRPFNKVKWISHFIKKVQQPQTNMPQGKNANTEKFILGLALCFCLFMKNPASLMKYGKPLKNYTNKYAIRVPVAQASLVNQKLTELILRISK